MFFVNIVFFITFIITFFVNKKAEKIKQLAEISPITYIMQLDAMFDILCYFYSPYESEARTLEFLYCIIFPIGVVFYCRKSNFKNEFYLIFTLILCLTVANTIRFSSIYPYKFIYLYIDILLQFLAIIACTMNTIKHKRNIGPRNYFFYLMLGFMILDFFWFLGYHKFIKYSFINFMKYHYFFVGYFTIYRIIYIAYVFVILKRNWKRKHAVDLN